MSIAQSLDWPIAWQDAWQPQLQVIEYATPHYHAKTSWRPNCLASLYPFFGSFVAPFALAEPSGSCRSSSFQVTKMCTRCSCRHLLYLDGPHSHSWLQSWTCACSFGLNRKLRSWSSSRWDSWARLIGQFCLRWFDLQRKTRVVQMDCRCDAELPATHSSTCSLFHWLSPSECRAASGHPVLQSTPEALLFEHYYTSIQALGMLVVHRHPKLEQYQLVFCMDPQHH